MTTGLPQDQLDGIANAFQVYDVILAVIVIASAMVVANFALIGIAWLRAAVVGSSEARAAMAAADAKDEAEWHAAYGDIDLNDPAVWDYNDSDLTQEEIERAEFEYWYANRKYE